jgi:hypothetical protein
MPTDVIVFAVLEIETGGNIFKMKKRANPKCPRPCCEGRIDNVPSNLGQCTVKESVESGFCERRSFVKYTYKGLVGFVMLYFSEHGYYDDFIIS